MSTDLLQAEGPVRYRVMMGEDEDPARRGAKVLVAQSNCSISCPSSEVFKKTMVALRDSDERLRALSADEKLYDWQTVYFEVDASSDNGAGTLIFGVAWYDEEFFAKKGTAYLGQMHTQMFSALGVPEEGVSVEHWRPVSLAA